MRTPHPRNQETIRLLSNVTDVLRGAVESQPSAGYVSNQQKVAEITSQPYRQLSDGVFFRHVQLILLGNIGKVMYRLRPPK